MFLSSRLETGSLNDLSSPTTTQPSQTLKLSGANQPVLSLSSQSNDCSSLCVPDSGNLHGAILDHALQIMEGRRGDEVFKYYGKLYRG